MVPFQKKNTHIHTRLVHVPAPTAVKSSLRVSTGKIKSNPLEPQPHFQTSGTMSRSLEGTKTAVDWPHCTEIS